jgi:uncharacterized membrane protein/protein-disulfide isomerase
MSKNIKPISYIYYYLPVVVLSLTGLIVSLYLSMSHYRVYTDIGYSSFCAISKAINCDTVSQSPQSILLGVPVPVWGVVGYLFLVLLLPFAYQKGDGQKNFWSIFFLTTMLYSLYSVYLAAVSTFIIHSYCMMCIVTYAVNLLLLYLSWIIIKRFNGEKFIRGIVQDIRFAKKNAKIVAPVFLIFILAVIVMKFNFNDYWNLNLEASSKEIPTGVTEDGHPWIGAENPELTIVEYNDYLCFQCKKMHFFLRSLVSKNAERIRLVHMHFPIDKKYNMLIKEDLHVGAGEMAMLAIYAGLREKFWEMNDLLFQFDRTKSIIDLNELSEKIDITINEFAWALGSKEIRLLLKRDIALGIKDGVTGTPSYVVRGKTYEGTIPADILQEIIEPE